MERIYQQSPYDVTQSLGYKQAGLEGKQRMELLAGMGLPMQSDINRLRYEGSNYYTRSPIYSAAPHQPWGSWGALSGPTTEDGSPVTTGKFDTSNSSTPSSGSMPLPAPRRPSSQERANIDEADAREARRQRIRSATQNATIFPYLRSKPAYDLGESRNSSSIFGNYPTYGPSPL